MALNLGYVNVDKMLDSITIKQWHEWQYMMSEYSYFFDHGNYFNALNIAANVNLMGNKTKPKDFYVERKKPQTDEEIMNKLMAL